VSAQYTERIATAFAGQQASNIHRMQQRIRARLQSAARSPLAQSAIVADADASANVELVEQAILDYFPEVLSLRVLALGDMGTAELASGSDGLRNNIELDLVRRTAEGNTPPPESYQFEGRWMTSFAERVAHPRIEDQRGVLLVTLDNEVVSRELAALQGAAGRFALEQRIDSTGRVDVVAASGAATGGETHRAPVPDTPWTVAFTPSAELVEGMTASRFPLLGVMAVCALCLIAGLALPLMLLRRTLATEVESIIAAADKKTPLELSMPELVGIAKQLRRATLRTLRPASVPGPEVAAPGQELAESGNPLFHRTGILVEEGEDEAVLELDVDTAEQAAAPQHGFPEHIFRAYDIRGLADTELTSELVTAVGGAIGTLAGEQDQQALVVGCDGRESSERIKNTLVRALLASGRDVIDIGLVSTPMLYFATHRLQCRSGVMVTGSHNPPEYNGLKIVIDRHTIAAGGITDILNRAVAGNFSKGSGRVVKENVTAAYIDEIADDVAVPVPIKVVVDAGNGATSPVAVPLFEAIGCDVVPLYCKVDPSFPNRSPDTSREENLSDLIAAVLQHQADLGVAFDGDGDRVAVVTPSGEVVRTDVLMMLFARDVVSRNPGADVVFDVKCSRNLAQVISENGGRPVLWKTGHAFMKEKMLETGALLGGEFSGHIFFGERWFGFDDGLYAAARLAEILSTYGESLDEAVAGLPATVNTPEILIPVDEGYKFRLMEAITRQADFPNGRLNTLDGLRVDFPSGWGLVRASNTSAALTARFEADSEEELESIKQQFRDLIDSVDPSLELPF
jgi:phosphomannomutase/phosphoglucomutase